MIIGITGKGGAGKSTLASNYAVRFNSKIICVDTIAHKVLHYPHIADQIKEKFNVDVNESPKVVLGDIIINDSLAKQEIDDIIWTEIRREVEQELFANDNVIIEWILLPRTHYFKLCDYKILVKADDEVRAKRVMERDSISREQFDAREANSIEYDEDEFDDVVVTS